MVRGESEDDVLSTILINNYSLSLPITVCVVTAVTLCLLSLTCLVLVFRTNLQVWLHSQYNIRLSGKQQPAQFIYDAFVSYSVQVGTVLSLFSRQSS